MTKATLAVFAVCLLSLAAVQAAPTEIAVIGAVETPLHLTAGVLRAMPSTEVKVEVPAGSHMQAGTFRGVLVSRLLAKALVKDKAGKNAFLQHSLLVSGRDGYAAALAIAECDPNYEGKTIIVAYDLDGRPLRDGFRLIVPGDHEGGRQVHDVVSIDVR